MGIRWNGLTWILKRCHHQDAKGPWRLPVLAISFRDQAITKQRNLPNCWRWRPHGCSWYQRKRVFLGCKRLWLIGPIVNERPSHRCWGLSLLTNSKTHWVTHECKNCLDCMRRCAYCSTYFWRPALFLGRWWLWLARSSWYTVHAQGRGWMSLLA